MTSTTGTHVTTGALAQRATQRARLPRHLLESGADPLEVIDAIEAAQASLRALKCRLVLDDCRHWITDRGLAPDERVTHLVATLSRGLRR